MTSNRKSVVSSGHPAVTSAAAEILKKGGNAYDAAIAAGFTGAVAEPGLTSLGGGGFLLARTAEGQENLFDFFVDTPGKGQATENLTPHFFPVTVKFSGSDQDFNIGMGSVAVPGNLKGFIHVHQRMGSLPLEEVISPAVNAARHGVRISRQQAYFLKLLYPIMTLTIEGKKLFEPEGGYLSEGDNFINNDLADFLEQLPLDQGESFYRGNIAARITGDMAADDGLLTRDDLASYEVKERMPLESSYRGCRLLTNPAPSLGGTLIVAALGLLEQFDPGKMKWGSAKHFAILSSVMQEIESLKNSGKSTAMNQWYARTADKIRLFTRGTTHVSVSDARGNVAAMTTSNGEGSGYIVPGTGIMLNNMMGEDDLHPGGFHSSPPGMRVASMMSPTVMVDDSTVKLVLGSGGSKRIRTAITQVISHIIDFGMHVDAAVKAPRVHWDGNTLQVEPGLDEETMKALQDKWPVNAWDVKDVYFGGVHAIVGNEGAGDPRRGGNSSVTQS